MPVDTYTYQPPYKHLTGDDIENAGVSDRERIDAEFRAIIQDNYRDESTIDSGLFDDALGDARRAVHDSIQSVEQQVAPDLERSYEVRSAPDCMLDIINASRSLITARKDAQMHAVN